MSSVNFELAYEFNLQQLIFMMLLFEVGNLQNLRNQLIEKRE